MPEFRLKKARESLPSGYQFGDAAPRSVERTATEIMARARGENIQIRYLKSYDIRVCDELQRKWREEFNAPEGAQLGRPIACR